MIAPQSEVWKVVALRHLLARRENKVIGHLTPQQGEGAPARSPCLQLSEIHRLLRSQKNLFAVSLESR